MQATSSTEPSLALLSETVAYLRRLPVVPSTQELIRKIEAHLGSPISQEVTPAPTALEGQVTTSAGTVLFSILVENGQATLLAPVTRRREQDAREQRPASRHLSPAAPLAQPGEPFGDFHDRPIDAMQVEEELDRARLLRLHLGVTVELEPSGFPSTHSILVEESQSNIKDWR